MPRALPESEWRSSDGAAMRQEQAPRQQTWRREQNPRCAFRAVVAERVLAEEQRSEQQHGSIDRSTEICFLCCVSPSFSLLPTSSPS